MSLRDPKPVVALDVDGVIRVIPAPRLDEFAIPTRYTLPANADAH
ncbi:hypothetical protein [Microbacterium aerolatum]